MENDSRRGVLVVTKDAGKYPYRSEILAAIPGARVAIVEGESGPFPGSYADWTILNWSCFYPRRQQVIVYKACSAAGIFALNSGEAFVG